jgi:hypothetical protein
MDSFKAQTRQGEVKLQPGQTITLPHDIAIRLLNEGKITPVEKTAYKVYSEILESYLWIINTDEDRHSLRAKGIKEAIYSQAEIKRLKGIDKDSLKAIHKVKETFENSKVEEVKTKRGQT